MFLKTSTSEIESFNHEFGIILQSNNLLSLDWFLKSC